MRHLKYFLVLLALFVFLPLSHADATTCFGKFVDKPEVEGAGVCQATCKMSDTPDEILIPQDILTCGKVNACCGKIPVGCPPGTVQVCSDVSKATCCQPIPSAAGSNDACTGAGGNGCNSGKCEPGQTEIKTPPNLCGAGAACCKGTPTKKSTSGSPIILTNPLGAGTTLFTVMQRVITAFLGMVGALALGVFVYAGVLWMTGGSSDRVKKAQETLKYAVLGLLMIAFAYTISAYFFGVLSGASEATTPATPQYAPPPPVNQ